VTGGAGFIGANFIRHVLQHHRDVSVTNYDALTYAGNLANLADVQDDPNYRFVRGDIADVDDVSAVVADHDAVVNFAAESHVDRSIDDAVTALRANVLGAQVLFDAAFRNGVERFLHVSTDEVYGSITEPDSADEDAPLAPSSPYAAAKASADLLARAYRVTHGYPITITRAVNNFGPYQYPEKVVPLFVTNLLQGRGLPLYGDGGHVRDWLYVQDNVAAQWLVLTEGEPGATYNVGAGNAMSNLALAHQILRRFDMSGIAAEELIEHADARPGHDRRYAVDDNRVRALGWSPRWTFDEALDATIDWYRANESWWGPLKLAGAGRRRGRAHPA